MSAASRRVVIHDTDNCEGPPVVDRLEAKGWCRRKANPDDRRSSLLVLTPAGPGLRNSGTAISGENDLHRLRRVRGASAGRSRARDVGPSSCPW
ncbi:MarR family transcriptional regulator [Microbispora corallina]|uniref:MarR family transcriptional regulator n=1 Tax=Microbispora corallina TaxID=83302 RepID=UPI0027DD01A3|nr:MarR family transcriptional regulator [Microbispora corallina]